MPNVDNSGQQTAGNDSTWRDFLGPRRVSWANKIMLQQSSPIGGGMEMLGRTTGTVRTLEWNSVLAVCFWAPTLAAICTKNANENVSAYANFPTPAICWVGWECGFGWGYGLEVETETENWTRTSSRSRRWRRVPSGRYPVLVSVGWEMIDRRASISQKCYCLAFDSRSIAGHQVL